jgi:uncharacterized protein (UPF0303 family)
MSVAELEAQETELGYEWFDQTSAWELGSILVGLAQERSLAVALGIDLGEQEVFRCGRPGTSADNDSWLRRKFAVVRRYNHSSLLMSTTTQSIPDRMAVLGLSGDRYAFSGGAFPLLVGGALVGCVGVSGLADTEDHALVVEGLRQHHRSRG